MAKKCRIIRWKALETAQTLRFILLWYNRSVRVLRESSSKRTEKEYVSG